MAQLVSLFCHYPFRCLILLFVALMQIRSYFTYSYIWPFSHKTVMYSRPMEYPFERLYLIDEVGQQIINTELMIPRPSKLTYLYNHYSLPDKSYQTYLEKLSRGHEVLRRGRVLLMSEMVHEFSPLCSEHHEDVKRAACLDEGYPCNK